MFNINIKKLVFIFHWDKNMWRKNPSKWAQMFKIWGNLLNKLEYEI